MKKISALCKIDGTLKIIKRREFDLCISTAPKGRYFLTLEKIYKKRSLNQNAYYFAVVVPLIRGGLFDVGYKLSIEQTHEYLKEQFLRQEIINDQTGEIKIINRSTTELKTVEFNEYFEEIIRWADEYLSIKIPYPNEFEEDN
jgi:hypothetical protein